jgi:two-component system chemotaxis response regulator CheB
MKKILIIDDSAVIRSILRGVLEAEDDMTVAGEAANGRAAAELNQALSPDMIIMNINLPIMNGLDAMRRIMREKPVPIVIFSGEATDARRAEALAAGAADVIRKPKIDAFNAPGYPQAFIARIRGALSTGAGRLRERVPRAPKPPGAYSLIVAGASTGGPLALREILRVLPKTFPACVAVVQHMEKGFDRGFAGWLDDATPLTVRLAGPMNPVIPGRVYIAPTDLHLTVKNRLLILEDGEKELNQKPSIDRLFHSASQCYKEALIGLLLTGMGRDGALGCRSIVSGGGITLVQDEKTSAIFGMPRAAIELNAATRVLPLSEISRHLLALAGGKGQTP